MGYNNACEIGIDITSCEWIELSSSPTGSYCLLTPPCPPPLQPCSDKEATRFQNDRAQGYLPHGTHRHARYDNGTGVTVDRGTVRYCMHTLLLDTVTYYGYYYVTYYGNILRLRRRLLLNTVDTDRVTVDPCTVECSILTVK